MKHSSPDSDRGSRTRRTGEAKLLQLLTSPDQDREVRTDEADLLLARLGSPSNALEKNASTNRRPDSDPPTSPAADTFTRRTVTTTMVIIALLTFTFSFGNVWALGPRPRS